MTETQSPKDALQEVEPWKIARSAFPFLTKKEALVLSYLALGMTNREIAKKIERAEDTVKIHLKNIFSKLGVDSRTKAALIAANVGLPSYGGHSKVLLHCPHCSSFIWSDLVFPKDASPEVQAR